MEPYPSSFGTQIGTVKQVPERPTRASIRPRTAVLVALSLCASIALFSQSEQPPFKANRNLPAFKLDVEDGTVFYSTRLKKNTPVILMFFSPGCDHCIHQFNDMLKRMNDFRNYQIVMATVQPMSELADFNKKYKMSKYPNIITGRDSEYFFPPFFQIANFPHFAFYGRNGKLIDSHEGNISVDDILKRFK